MTPSGGENLTIIDTEGNNYTDFFADFNGWGAGYSWPALKIVWGDGTPASTGPFQPYDLAHRLGEGKAFMTVGIDPSTGEVTFTLTGVVTNPTDSPLTITELAFQLGGAPDPGQLVLRYATYTATYTTDLLAYGKKALIAYLPVNLQLDPGEAVQVVFKLRFTPL